MLFNRFSKAVFLLVKIALNGSSASESGGVKRESEWKKKVFNSLKALLIVQREQQIGLTYKTLIDLWKVEATAGSHVPMLNCTPGLSPYETVIIKKWVLFQSKSLDDAESVIKGWILLLQLYMISFPDLRGQGSRFARRWKALVACFCSFTFHV